MGLVLFIIGALAIVAFVVFAFRQGMGVKPDGSGQDGPGGMAGMH